MNYWYIERFTVWDPRYMTPRDLGRLWRMARNGHYIVGMPGGKPYGAPAVIA